MKDYERRFRLLDGHLGVLERERQKLSAVLSHTDAGVLVFDAAARVTWANAIFVRRFSARAHPGQVLGAPCHEVLCRGGTPCEACPAAQSLRSGALVHHEIRLDIAGRERHIYTTALPIRSPSGAIDESIVMLQDVSDLEVLRQSQEALRASEERFRSIFEQAGAGMATVAPDGTFLQVNAALAKFLGYSEAELLKMRVQDVTHPDDQEQSLQVLADLRSGSCRVVDLEKRYVRKEGVAVWGHVTATSLFDAERRPTYSVALVQDIDERKRAEEALRRTEEQLRHAQKMEAIGTLAGGVAHDFNNLLTGILGYAEILKRHSAAGDRVYEAADVIETAARRAATMTQQLLGFARKGKHQNVAVDMHATIQEVIGLLSRTIDKRIVVKQDFRDPTARVLGDPSQMHQMILNLAVNAAEAMPGGGELTVSTELLERPERDPRGQRSSPAESQLLVSVRDTGLGIPSELQERVFEPFFTTKEQGKGTGMGLAMVYGIVKNHGGSIRLRSQPGQGTTVQVFLPAASRTAIEDAAAPDRRLVNGAGRILVVDDEEVVRRVAEEFLRLLGYEVITAVDGREAVEIYGRQGADVDLVIIDMIMPRLGGRECYRALKQMNQKIKAVLSTGYGCNVAAQEILDEGMLGFIQKPYQMQQLSEVVASALRGTGIVSC